MSIFSFLTTQEVPHLLHVSIQSSKEARRTFLTEFKLSEEVIYVFGTQEVLRLLHVLIQSSKEARRMFLTPDGVQTFRRSQICI
jgi:hypothetical protein